MAIFEPTFPRTGVDRIRNFWLHVADGALFPAGYALLGPQTLLPLLVARWSDSRWWVGVVAAVVPLGLAAPQLLSARWLERFPGRWRYFLLTNWACRLALIPLVGVPLLPDAWQLVGLVVALGFFALAWGIAAPAWMDMIQRVIHPEDRGRFFGWRATLQGPATLVAQALAGWLLAVQGYPAGFVACFALAFMLKMLSMVLMALTIPQSRSAIPDVWAPVDAGLAPDEVPFPTASPGTHSPGADPLRSLEGRAFLAWRLALSTACAALPFTLLDARSRFNLTDGDVMTLGLALFILPTLSSVWWGRQGDRHGPWWLLTRATWVAVPAHACLVWAPSPLVHAIGLAGLGLLQPLLVLADFAFLGGGEPRTAAARYGRFNLVLLLATLGGPLAAGAWAEQAGTGGVLAIAGAIWTCAAFGIAMRSFRLRASVA